VKVALDATAVPDLPGGAGRYVVDLSAALAIRRDVDLTLVCRRHDKSRWEATAPGATVVAAAPRPRPLRLGWEQAVLPGLLARNGVQVHHGPHYTMPLRSGRPTVVTVHDLSLVEHPEWHHRSKVAFFGGALRLAMARADAVIAVSEATAEGFRRQVAKRFRSAASKRDLPIHVIHHGVDHERFHSRATAADAALVAALGVRAPYVLFLGTLEPRKDVVSLVRAFSRLAPRHRDLRLVLAGSPGWGREAVEAAVAASPVGKRILRTGYVAHEAVAALLRAAAVVAYPSLDEGFGLPALEALACGAPLVTTTGSAMEEVAGGAASLVAPGDEIGLAEALEEALAGGAAVDERCRQGLTIATGYTWSASAAAHAAVYHSLV